MEEAAGGGNLTVLEPTAGGSRRAGVAEQASRLHVPFSWVVGFSAACLTKLGFDVKREANLPEVGIRL